MMQIRNIVNGPRPRWTYRQLRKIRAIEWYGVEPDWIIERPRLVQKESLRGFKYYVEEEESQKQVRG